MKKILYVASTYGHIKSFHIPYILKLVELGFEMHIGAGGTEKAGAQKAPTSAAPKMQKNTGASLENQAFAGVKTIEISFEKKMCSHKNLICVKKLVRLMEKEKYDIVSVHTSLAAFFTRLAVILVKGKKPTVINTVHGYLFDENTRWAKKNILLGAERIVKKATDVLVVMNNQDYEIAEKYRLYREKLIKIPGMGINIDKFSKEHVEMLIEEKGQTGSEVVKGLMSQRVSGKATGESADIRSRERAKFGLQEADVVMIYAAEFSKRKNQKMLIHSMEKLPPNVKLFLAGKGEGLEECMSLAEHLRPPAASKILNSAEQPETSKPPKQPNLTLPSGGRVVFLGHVQNLEYYYYLADICVSSSRSEGLPFNIMEGMAMGLPVVATNVKGHQDLVENGVNGYLYEFDDQRGFIEGVMSLIKPKSACEATESKGRENQRSGNMSYCHSVGDTQGQQAVVNIVPQNISKSICDENVRQAQNYGLENIMNLVMSIYTEVSSS